jgi:ABC-type dipeptide/oligopeptide/nickel transport system permease subunit
MSASVDDSGMTAATATTRFRKRGGLAGAHRGLWTDAWRRLKRNKAAVVGLVFIVALVLIAVFAPLIAPFPPDRADFLEITQPPSRAHLLGTDSLGQDVLSRLIYGTRVSLTVGFVAQFVIVLIGVPVGLISAYYGGWIDLIVQRVVDILYAFPSLLFVIVVMTYVQANLHDAHGPVSGVLSDINESSGGLLGVFLALAAVFWLTVSRLVRGEAMALKRREFVDAARCVGASDAAIMRRHILPNCLAPIIVATTFGIPSAIMVEAGLSFLGLGVQPPTPSWGLMISEGVKNVRSYPYLLASSGVLLSLTLLAFNFLGDGLRDAFDPWMKR